MCGYHTAQCIGITKLMVICFSTFYCCYGNRSCTIRCYFENGRVAALKGLFNVLNNNKWVLFFDILTQNMLNKIDRVFDMNSLALIFSERHLNLKMIILTSFFSVVFWRHLPNFTIVFTIKCSYLNKYTRYLHEIFSICSAQFDIHDVCKNRKSHFMSLMQVFWWLGIFTFLWLWICLYSNFKIV